LSHRLAFRWDGELFARFSTERPTKPGWTAARGVLVVLSAALVLVPVGLLLNGILLLVRDFFSWGGLLGVVLVLLALCLRPRLGRAPRRKRALRREQAPTLFALVDRVADAAGTSPPHMVVVDTSFDVGTGSPGPRRTPVLWIGAPMWAALAPRQRVAVLAHELGHQINGDPGRGLLVRPALSTFRGLVEATGGGRDLRDVVFDEHRGVTLPLPIAMVLWLVNRVVLVVHLGLSALGGRDHQRAEYLADSVAVDVAGSAATASLFDRLTLLPQVAGLLVHHAETKASGQWGAMAESMHAAKQDDLPALRQLTHRNTWLWATHPPTGLRARMVEAWPHQDPRVVLTDAESARIDAELAPWYVAAHREFLGSRDYRGPRA
jgi:Zn-dependent protease with chaperone function